MEKFSSKEKKQNKKHLQRDWRDYDAEMTT